MAAHNPFPDKVIVTTATKVRLLQSLSEFWSLKSLFIQAKTNPGMLGSEGFQQRALDYFEKSSALAKQKFWSSLSLEARKKAAKYFVLQEVQDTAHSRMTTTKESAALYIVLNGSATVKTSDCPDEVVYNTGEVFGAVDIFNETFDNHESGEPAPDSVEDPTKQRVLTASMKKGTYLRISLADFYKHVLSVDKVDTQGAADQEEACRISELPWGELTDEDKFFVELYKKARRVLKKDLFDFMATYKMLPNNARAAAKKFFREGHIGHSVELTPHEPPSVFMFLEGGVRLEVESRRGGPDGRTVSCRRKGKQPMVVKTYTMPLVLLESGSLMLLNRDSYFFGDATAEGEAPPGSPQRGADPPEALPVVPVNHLPNRPQRDSIASEGSIAPTSDSGPTPNARAVRKKQKPVASTLYKLRLAFERTTHYLQIPWSAFERHLEERVVPRPMASSIRAQMGHTQEIVTARLRNLQPWIAGGIAFAGPPILSSVGDYSAAPLDGTLLLEVAARDRQRKQKKPMGSFGGSRLQLNTEGSQDTASYVSTVNGSSAFTSAGHEPAAPPSRLRGIITKIKNQRVATKRAMRKLSFIAEASVRASQSEASSLAGGDSLASNASDGADDVDDPPLPAPSAPSPSPPSRRASLSSGISNQKPFGGLDMITEDR